MRDRHAAHADTHAAPVALGFEGGVLKQSHARYRPERHRAWRKHKACRHTSAELMALRLGRDGQAYAVCDIDGRTALVLAGPQAAAHLDHNITLVYTGVEADGTLREARLAGRGLQAPSVASLQRR